MGYKYTKTTLFLVFKKKVITKKEQECHKWSEWYKYTLVGSEFGISFQYIISY